MPGTVHAKALIVQDQQALLLHDDAQGYWELPGAPVEDGETARAAAIRGAEDCLSCTVRLRSTCNRMELDVDHDGASYGVRCFLGDIVDGEPSAVTDRHAEVAWQDADALATLDVAPTLEQTRDDLRLLLLRSAGA